MTWSQVSRKYGPVLYLWFGSRPVLLVSSPSAAEECFTKNDIIFANRPTMLVGELLNYNSSTLAWLPYGYHWRNLRRIATIELLSSKTVRMLSPIRVDEVRSLIQRLFFQVSDENNLERIVDIKSALVELAFNVMTRMICAKTYYGESMENAVDLKIFGGVVAEISNEARKSTILDFMPFLRFFGYRKVVKKLVELNEKRDKLLQKLVEDNRRIRSDDDPALTDRVQGRNRSMIQVLMQLQASEPENYPDEIIKGLIMVRHLKTAYHFFPHILL
ncbi:hypothetical protein ACH5RR_024004 [Cinchona calisaya]|uniref:Cytochrome P450 n=1 Tax=Cinchona calisaya TaxID=153742 RepID=A0ABD2ZFC8_9GENT